jgi:hypothetical protein
MLKDAEGRTPSIGPPGVEVLVQDAEGLRDKFVEGGATGLFDRRLLRPSAQPARPDPGLL